MIFGLVTGASPVKVGIDEGLQVAVEHTLDVPHLHVGAEVLGHLIRLEDVGADLATPSGFTLFAPDLVEVVEALLPGPLGEPGAGVGPWPGCGSAVASVPLGRRLRPRSGYG